MSQTVASLVVESLIANRFDQLYCLPGVQNDDFFDALYDRQDALTPIQTRHEQGAAYMATGAAIATGQPQAFCVVPGPGFLNATAALSTAYAVNAPVFALVGQIPSGAMGKGFGLLHELPDQLAIMQGLTKQAATVSGGTDAAAALKTAMEAVKSGRPRPVGLEVPVNVWKNAVEGNIGPLAVEPPAGPPVDTDQIQAAAALLRDAKNPMIFVGSGAQGSSADVTQLADMVGAPVMGFRTGKGVVSADHDLSIGAPVAHALWSQCDVAVGLGTRLQMPQMQWGTDDDLKIIHIDIDPQELGRIKSPDVGINADLRDALPALLGELDGKEDRRQDWRDSIAETKAAFEKRYQDQVGPQLAWMNALRTALPRNGLIVDELTQIAYVSRIAFPVYEPRTFISTGYQGTLGWGIATGLGAAHARRDVPVVSIAGDGGAMYTIGELATAVRHNIPLTCVIFNDNAFGNVRRFQIENYNNRPIASDLASPDFVKLAESFGVAGRRAETPEALTAALEAAFNSGAPNVIEVPVGDFPSPWEFIMMPKVRG